MERWRVRRRVRKGVDVAVDRVIRRCLRPAEAQQGGERGETESSPTRNTEC